MIKAVAKAIDILHVFNPSEPRLSLGEIARRLDLPKATAHNLLATLIAYQFVERTDDNLYALGTALVSITQSVRVNVELRDRAAPLLRELADRTRETVYLTVLDNDRPLYIYAVESPSRLLARTAVGDRVLLHCTSVGKAMLSVMTVEEVDRLVGKTGLPAFTSATITDLPALHTELAATRSRGFSLDRGEHEVGTYCIGAPIFNADGRVVASCSISGTDPEIVGDRQVFLSTAIMSVAHQISQRMGYVPRRVSGVPVSMMDSTNK